MVSKYSGSCRIAAEPFHPTCEATQGQVRTYARLPILVSSHLKIGPCRNSTRRTPVLLIGVTLQKLFDCAANYLLALLPHSPTRAVDREGMRFSSASHRQSSTKEDNTACCFRNHTSGQALAHTQAHSAAGQTRCLANHSLAWSAWKPCPHVAQKVMNL